MIMFAVFVGRPRMHGLTRAQAAEARVMKLTRACERIAELADGPAYPPALGHAIMLARAALATDEA